VRTIWLRSSQLLAEFWQIPTLGVSSQSNTNLPQGSTEQPPSTPTSMQPTTTTATASVVPTHRWGNTNKVSVVPTHRFDHTKKVGNGVTELCGLWSKNIHSTWYQQFKGFAALKGVVAGQAHAEQQEDPRVTKILNFLSERNVAIPSNLCLKSC